MLLLSWLLLLGSAFHQGLNSWEVTSPENVQGIHGSCLVIPCTFSFPRDVKTDQGITAIWYRDYSKADKKVVVSHSQDPGQVEKRFQGRTKLLGDPRQKTCDLLIQKLSPDDNGDYTFRFQIIGVDSWSAKKSTAVKVTDEPSTPTIASPAHLQEDTKVIFNCSTPYVCPEDGTPLSWHGQDPVHSNTSQLQVLAPTGVTYQQSLSVALSWRDHGRMLTCQFSAAGKQSQKQIHLQVQYAPRGVEVSLRPSQQNIHLGDSFALTCHINGSHPEPTAFRWFKNGDLYNANQKVLQVSKATWEDHGHYSCEAQNVVGTGAAAPITVPIFDPLIRVHPPGNIQEGQAVTLTCTLPAGEQQNVSYSWFKNNVWIEDLAAQTLVYAQVSSADTGFYFCQVQNSKGVKASPPVNLVVTYSPRVPVLTSFLETQRGQKAIIHCSVDSEPQAKLTLWHGGQLLASSSSQDAPSQRFSVSSGYNSLRLIIRGLDTDDGGDYQCEATNALGKATSSHDLSTNTAWVGIDPTAEVVEGEEVTLSCVAAQGDQPYALYTWYRNGEWLKDGPLSFLTFPKVLSANAGSYHCRAQDSLGSSRTSPPAALTVLYPPRQPTLTALVDMEAGRLGLLLCRVESDPPADLRLLRGDQLVATSQGGCGGGQRHPRAQATSSPNSLRVEIRDVVLEDEGEYTCEATNTLGNSTASVAFEAQTTRLLIFPSATVTEGDKANLTCVVSRESNSSPTNLTWYRDGAEWAQRSQEAVILQPVVRTDAALYSCHVSTEIGERRSPAVALHVLYPPDSPQLSAFLDTTGGRVAVFRCTVDSSPSASMTLFHGEELVASSLGSRASEGRQLWVQASPNSLRVEIKDLRLEDTGNYRCQATNAHGSASTTIFFQVHAAWVQVSPSLEVHEGEAVSLSCKVTGGAPDGTAYEWYRDSRHLSEPTVSTLHFPSITAEQGGTYHCQARTPAGAASLASPVSLHVSYPPRQPTLTALLELEAGRLGLILCQVDSDPQAQLRLLRGSQLLASSQSRVGVDSPRVTRAFNVLRVEIPNVVLEDEGEYTCEASNVLGNATASVAFSAETVVVQVLPLPTVQEGQAVNLTCVVSATDVTQLNYTWYRNGQWVAGGPGYSSIFLPNVSAADATSYRCAVDTHEGSTRFSSSKSLTVLYPPRALHLTSLLDSRAGQPAVLLCTVDSQPPATLALSWAGQLLASSSLEQARLGASSTPNTLRLELQEQKALGSGLYTCSAANSLGQANTSLELHLEVTRVSIAPSSEVPEGTAVILTCEDPAAKPPTIYTWYHNGRWLQEGPAYVLQLPGTTSALDAGAYSCTARDARGIRRSQPATLRHLYAPRDVFLTSFLDTRAGRVTVLQCTVDSEPPAELTLSRDGELVASGQSPLGSLVGRSHVQTTHNTLRLELWDVSKQDEGDYLCSAQNAFGSITTTGQLWEEGLRVMVEPGLEIHEGDSLNMTCLLTSQAQENTTYTWSWNSRWLQESPEPTLVFSQVASNHAGVYQCHADGSLGHTSSAPISLKVLYAPRTPAVTSFLEPEAGLWGILHCHVDSEPRSELTLYHGSHLIASTRPGSHRHPHVQVSTSYNTLRVDIQDMNSKDQGEYVCLASNALGSAASSVYFGTRVLDHLNLYQLLFIIFMVLSCCLLLLLGLGTIHICKRKSLFYKLNADENLVEMASQNEKAEVEETEVREPEGLAKESEVDPIRNPGRSKEAFEN
ncbi:sialoadhesin isoform X2 [Phascolarctos cinereus]|uniref:Sialoadhesin n=1 Tax=Phascolarctos cinereus TaxID=38626 RepID=A0A6P5LFR1_PHACI|nr:sialoadhesin isoform X2 [Phascolarctos cinereus]